MSRTNITSLSQNAFYGCSSLQFLVIPETVTDVSKLDPNMLNGANVSNVSFLGIDNYTKLENRIKLTGFFGYRKTCSFQLKNSSKLYQYNYFSNTVSVIQNDAGDAGQRKLTSAHISFNPPAGKRARFFCGILYEYNTQLVDKLLNVNKLNGKLPIIVFFVDSRTSSPSREFIDKILKTMDFKKTSQKMESFPPAIYLYLDRNTANQDTLTNFTDNFLSGDRTKVEPFPCIVVKYKNKTKIKSFHSII